MKTHSRIRQGLLLLALLAGPANAASLFSPGGGLGWLPGLFQLRRPLALDYILVLVGLLVAVALAIFYYRGKLYDALMEMQPPGQVKVRAASLGLMLFAIVLMLAPNLPVGVLLLIALVGCVLAALYGLSLLVAAALILGAVALVVLKILHPLF